MDQEDSRQVLRKTLMKEHTVCGKSCFPEERLECLRCILHRGQGGAGELRKRKDFTKEHCDLLEDL